MSLKLLNGIYRSQLVMTASPSLMQYLALNLIIITALSNQSSCSSSSSSSLSSITVRFRGGIFPCPKSVFLIPIPSNYQLTVITLIGHSRHHSTKWETSSLPTGNSFYVKLLEESLLWLAADLTDGAIVFISARRSSLFT